MKRFLYFAYDGYYPSGGLSDVLAEFDTLEEWEAYKKAEHQFDPFAYDYGYLFDCETRQKVWELDENRQFTYTYKIE